MGYAFDRTSQSIRRIDYGHPDPLPEGWPYPTERGARIGNAAGFRVTLAVQHKIPLLTLYMDSTTDRRMPLSTTVRLRAAYPESTP